MINYLFQNKYPVKFEAHQLSRSNYFEHFNRNYTTNKPKGALMLFVLIILSAQLILAQEVTFFTEGTNSTFYDQGIVDVANLGESTFEHTYPPGGPQWNDKVPCSTLAHKGSSSLKFNYASSVNGNWKVTIYRNDWSLANISAMDSLSFYLYTENDFPAQALPLIGIKTTNQNGTGEAVSSLYPLSTYNNTIVTGQWNRITFPLSIFISDINNLNLTGVKGIIFNQSEKNGTARTILIDDIAAFQSIDFIPPASNFSAMGYDSHAELNWNFPMDNLTYMVLASFDNGQTFELRGETTENYYLDFVPVKGKNSTVIYRLVATTQGKLSEAVESTALISDFTDDELLEMLQQYTFRYFWEGAHQASGMALERSNGNANTVASGASGMGLMAMIAAHEREWRPRDSIKERVLAIFQFLEQCDRHHGAWSHWYNAQTYRTQPFSTKDNGGDLVETSYVAAGLIAVKNYFTGTDQLSLQIREKADRLWREIEWSWYRNNNQNVLYWHWSPNYAFDMNMKINGWNECLVTYLLAAASPTHSIPAQVYHQGWAQNGNMVRKRTYYQHEISLSPDWGGPLFWLHYSFLGINPEGLKDQYADYWLENVNTVKIHHAYAVDNPKNHNNYSEKNWGLTASDDPSGYTAHQPVNNDNGTISPTAALSSIPYTPEESMKALNYFYRERGADLFGKYGPYDAFNDNLNWVQKAYIGIDQGPIVVMTENYRSGLIWDLVMNDPDVKNGLIKLNFQSQTTNVVHHSSVSNGPVLFPNPASDVVQIRLSENMSGKPTLIKIYTIDGTLISSMATEIQEFNVEKLGSGLHLVCIQQGSNIWHTKLMVNH